jgi:hypothetical protein
MYAAQLEEEAQAEREAQELLLLADRSRPPRWDPLGVAPFAWHLPEPGPPPPPPLTRSERIRDILLVGINGLIALAWEVGKSWLQALRTLVVLSAKVLVFPFRMFGRLLKWVGPVVLWRTAVTALAASLVAGGFGRQDVQISLLGASLLLLLAAVLASYAKPRKRSSRSRCSTCGRFVSGYSGYCDSCRASDTDLLDAFGEMDAATGQIADRITDLQRQISDLQSGLPCEVCGDMGVVTTEPRRRCKVCQERAARPTRWMGAY